MIRLVLSLFLFSVVYADGQAPTFMPIDPSEDFYSSSDVYLEVQVMDQSELSQVSLYYRFSGNESFTQLTMEKELYYVGEIPESEVIPGRLEYYFFARDEFGNQSTWPEGGEESPESIPIFEPLYSGGESGDILVEMLNPTPNESNDDASIIILSLYDPEGSIDLSNIKLYINDEDVSESIFKSVDMVTYVSQTPLEPGEHEVLFQLADQEGMYLQKLFEFSIAEIDVAQFEKVDWKEVIQLKGSLSYDSDYDEFFGKDRPDNRPFDSHKLNASVKFTLGPVKVKSSALINTHLIDETAKSNLERSQPLDRLKFGLSSPSLDFKYGDFSTEFSELTLKGTRVRGMYSRLKLGPWKTSVLSGNTKELISFENLTDFDPGLNVWNEGEDFTDSNENGMWDDADQFIDEDGNGVWDEGEELTSDYNGNGEWDDAEDFVDVPKYDWLQVDDSTESVNLADHTKGTASRKMNALRTELDFSAFNFGINVLTSYDDIDEYALPFEELYSQYTFLGNAVAGTDFTLRLNNKKTQLKVETAISLMNDLNGTPIDTLAESLDMPESQLNQTKDLFSAIEDVVGFNINSDLIIGSSEGRGISVPLPNMDSLDVQDYLLNDVLKNGTYRFTFKIPIEFEENDFDIQAEYKRIPSNFVSLGNSSIQTDIQGLKSSIKGRLFKNKLSLSCGYDNESDNLMGESADEKLKSSTTTTKSQSFGFGINIPEYPTFNYSIRIMDREGVSIEDESLTASNKTMTHTISPSYKFDTENNTNVSVSANIMMMNYNDNLYDASDATMTNSNFTTGSYTGSLGLRFDSPLTFNLGGGISINTPEDSNMMPTQFLVVSSKLGYKFWEKTLSTFLGLNMVSGGKDADALGEGEIDNLKLTVKLGAQYKLSKNLSIGLNTDYIILSDKVNPTNDFSELKGKIKLKIGF